jgi:TIR domain
MAGRVGFWSYVQDDDAAERGRVRQLASDLQEQYALISGEPIEIFVDRDAIAWGDDWREQIDSSLASILFFMPVITPRYFQSAQCRRELQEFARGAERLGVRELVLPLVYVDVPALREESPTDEAIALVKTYQWVDWRDLRFEDVTSGAYRRAVAGLGQRLVDANRRVLAEEPPPPEATGAAEVPGPDETPGTLDVLAAGEEALPRLGETLTAIGSEIQTVGNLAQQAAEDIQRGDQQGKGFAARLAVSRRLALDLAAPAERILELANSYTTSLYEVDSAMRIIIAQAPAETKDNPAAKAGWDQISTGVTDLANITNQAVPATQGLVDSMTGTESISRDLRPPIQKLRQGLTILTEGASVINEWKRLVDEAPLSGDADASGEPAP